MSLPPDTGAVELTAFRQHTAHLLARGERLDRRGFAELRHPSTIREVGSSCCMTEEQRGRGSSSGLLSSVMYTDDQGACISCTVHGVFGPPWAQRPNEGRLNVHVNAPFLPEYGGAGSTLMGNTGLVHTAAVDLPLRQVEGYVLAVLESCVDLTQLSILPAEACWVITVSITLLNVDGGLRAAALHAAVAALHDLVLPRARLPNGEVVERRVLRLCFVPVACTFAVLGGETVRLLADPTAIEEAVADGILTITVDEYDNIVDLQQLGQYPLMTSVLQAAIQVWKGSAAGVRKGLLSA